MSAPRKAGAEPAAAGNLLSTKQVAARLGISDVQVRRFVSDGELVTVDLSRPGEKGRRQPRLRFTEATVAEFIARRTQKTGAGR